MTDPAHLRGKNQKPLSGHDAPHSSALDTDVTALGAELLDQQFAKQFAMLNRYFEANQAGYENRRNQLRQNPGSLRIISSVRRELLFTPEIGLEDRGSGAPVFSYMPPSTNEGIKAFKQEISTVVMHSFGRGYDRGQLANSSARTVPIDARTGHNPRRFANGVSTFITPQTGTNVHHSVSLRGDLVNIVSWDNRCIHANECNDYSIGIEHEEWFRRSFDSNGRPIPLRDIQDQGPFSEAQYAVDAFILKKLEAYTGKSFTNYLGVGQELVQNLKARNPGCVAHAAIPTSSHNDPGGEFYLPLGFELGVTPVTAIPLVRTSISKTAWERAWTERFAMDWYQNLPRGTRISAYDRIFDKVNRLRSFDLQSEVFDPALNNSRIPIVVPAVKGTYTVALAEKASQNKLSAIQRAQQMQNASRVQAYTSAQSTNNAVAEAWARNTANLIRVQQTRLDIPVVVNAIYKDRVTGEWVRGTNTTTLATNSSVTDPATPVTDNA